MPETKSNSSASGSFEILPPEIVQSILSFFIFDCTPILTKYNLYALTEHEFSLEEIETKVNDDRTEEFNQLTRQMFGYQRTDPMRTIFLIYANMAIDINAADYRLVKFASLRSLILSGDCLPNVMESIFKYNPSIRNIHMSYGRPNIFATKFSSSRIPKHLINMLSLGRCELTQADIQVIAACKGLKKLKLSYCTPTKELTEAFLSVMKQVKGLNTLQLQGFLHSPAHFEEVLKIPSIKSLVFQFNKAECYIPIQFSCPHITSLSFEVPYSIAEGVTQIITDQVSDQAIISLTKFLPNLRKLKIIHQYNVTAAVLPSILSSPSLQHLELEWTKITPKDLIKADMSNSKIRNLHYNPFDGKMDNTLQLLRSLVTKMKYLKSLWLTNFDINMANMLLFSDEDDFAEAQVLAEAKLEELRLQFLSKFKYADAFVRQLLAQTKTLKYLGVFGVSNAIFDSIAANNTLKWCAVPKKLLLSVPAELQKRVQFVSNYKSFLIDVIK